MKYDGEKVSRDLFKNFEGGRKEGESDFCLFYLI